VTDYQVGTAAARWRRLVPGQLATHGADLWVADVSQPWLVLLRDDRLVVALRWLDPDGQSTASRLYADQSGVWIVASDAVRHCTPDGLVRMVVDREVGASALSHGVLATTRAATWPADPEPQTVRLSRLSGDYLEVEVPCVIHEIKPVVDGFLAYAIDHGPCPDTALSERSPRLVHLSTADEVRVGPPLAAAQSGPALVGGPQPHVMDGESEAATRLRRVLPDLSLGAGAFPGWPLGLWEGAGPVALLATHVPDGTGSEGWWPLPGPSAPTPALTRSYLIFAVDCVGESVVDTLVVPGMATSIACSSSDCVWISLQRLTYDDQRSVILGWDLGTGREAREVDLAGIVGDDLMLPVRQVLTAEELASYVEDQRLEIEDQFQGPQSDFRVLGVTLSGAWPDAHVVVRFVPNRHPDTEGAVAWPLFDGDGLPLEPYDWTDHLAVEVMEDLGTGVFSRVLDRTPASETVWTRPPRPVDGLLAPTSSGGEESVD
jgi:hypothetical protein